MNYTKHREPYIHTYIHVQVHVHIYIYNKICIDATPTPHVLPFCVCVRVGVCVCVRACARAWVCVCVRLCIACVTLRLLSRSVCKKKRCMPNGKNVSDQMASSVVVLTAESVVLP